MIRIVGLSATLPNYRDVGRFLGVSAAGLFYFDASYRPVPLEMQFLGVSERNFHARSNLMDEICYQKARPVPADWRSRASGRTVQACRLAGQGRLAWEGNCRTLQAGADAAGLLDAAI